MARHPRLMVPGVAAHIVQRGVNRLRCFSVDEDYLVYLSVLGQALRRAGCALHAYCLMTNHVHLLLTPSDSGGCSTLMYEVGQRYVPYFNRRHRRSGTLWEGRFRSCLVESREYVLACHRYIELNPIRAGMVASPSAYRWSSYSGNIGQRKDPLLSEHGEYEALCADVAGRYSAYERFCQDGEPPDFLSAVREATNGGIPLVGEPFKLQLATWGLRVERGKPGPRSESAGNREPTPGELSF